MSLTSQDKGPVEYKHIQKVPNTEVRTLHPALQPIRFKPTPGKECPPYSTVSTSVALTETNKINGVNLFHLHSNPTDCFQRTKCRQLSYWQHFFPSNLKSLIGCHSYKWAQIKVGTSGLSKIFEWPEAEAWQQWHFCFITVSPYEWS